MKLYIFFFFWRVKKWVDIPAPFEFYCGSTGEIDGASMGMHINHFEGDTDDDGRVSPARIRAYLDYHPETGWLTFREPRNRAMKHGDRAGYVRSGRTFRDIKIGAHRFREDRVAWAHAHGRWPLPGYDITHINGDDSDSRLANLREELVLRSMPRGPRNGCGYVGVVPVRGRFMSRIRNEDGDEVPLGTFDTPEEAHEAWRRAALERQIMRDMRARGLVPKTA